MRTLLASLAAVAMFTLLILVGVVYTNIQPNANANDKITICHAAGQDDTLRFVTLTLNEHAVYGQAGHFYENGTPRAGHENDYFGECEVIATPTSTPTPSPTPSPTPTPTPEHCGMADRTELLDCPTPSPTPSPTPTPTPAPTPCEDNEERLPDGTCRVVHPPECIPWPDDEAPWSGWPCVASPTPMPSPSPTPTPTPVADLTPTPTAPVPVTFPDTGGEPARK